MILVLTSRTVRPSLASPRAAHARERGARRGEGGGGGEGEGGGDSGDEDGGGHELRFAVVCSSNMDRSLRRASTLWNVLDVTSFIMANMAARATVTINEPH